MAIITIKKNPFLFSFHVQGGPILFHAASFEALQVVGRSEIVGIEGAQALASHGLAPSQDGRSRFGNGDIIIQGFDCLGSRRILLGFGSQNGVPRPGRLDCGILSKERRGINRIVKEGLFNVFLTLELLSLLHLFPFRVSFLLS